MAHDGAVQKQAFRSDEGNRCTSITGSTTRRSFETPPPPLRTDDDRQQAASTQSSATKVEERETRYATEVALLLLVLLCCRFDQSGIHLCLAAPKALALPKSEQRDVPPDDETSNRTHVTLSNTSYSTYRTSNRHSIHKVSPGWMYDAYSVFTTYF